MLQLTGKDISDLISSCSAKQSMPAVSSFSEPPYAPRTVRRKGILKIQRQEDATAAKGVSGG